MIEDPFAPAPSALAEKAARRFRRRATGILAAGWALRYSAGWLALWGTAVVVLRAGFGLPISALAWGAVGLLGAFALAFWNALATRPTLDAARALVDRHGRHGGLVMAGAEVGLGLWAVRPPEAPRLRWRSGRSWALLGLASAFVVAAFLVPLHSAAVEEDRRFELGGEVEALSEDLERLSAAEVVEEERVRQLAEELAAVEARASAEDPAAAWEALDHLAEQVETAASEAAESALAEVERLAAAETMASRLAEAGLEGGELAEALSELGSLIADGEIRDLEALDAAGLRELAANLGEERSALRERLGELSEMGALGAAELARAVEPGALESFLEGRESERGSGERVLASCELPGVGAVSRGPGHAVLAFDGAPPEGAELRAQALPPGALGSSRLVGESIADPADPSAISGRSSGSASLEGAGSAATQTLLPQHRRAVARYFERGERGERGERNEGGGGAP